MLLLVLHHFSALSDEVWSGLGQRSPQAVSRYGLLPPLVICLKFIEGNAFGLPTTIKHFSLTVKYRDKSNEQTVQTINYAVVPHHFSFWRNL